MKRFLIVVIDFYWGRGLAYVAPALAFYLLLLLPSLLLGFAALGSLLFDNISAEQITPFIVENFAPDLRQPIERFSRSVFSGGALLVSIPLMIWTLSAVLSLLERVMSPQPESPKDFVLGRIRLIGVATLLVALIVAGLLLVGRWGSLLFIPLLLFLLSLLLYRFLPRKRPSWPEALSGALPATAMLLLAPRIFAAYIDWADLSILTGLLGAVLLLLSSYLLAIALLVGAGIASRRTYK